MIVVIVIILIVVLAIVLSIAVSFALRSKGQVDELTRKNLELKKSNDVKDRVFSIIGHDLIGYISTMPIAMQMGRSKDADHDEREFLLDQVEVNASAALETLQNLLDWGKLQIKGIPLNQVYMNSAEISKEVIRLIGIAAERKHISIYNNLPTDTIVCCDPNHFKFIIRNLLSNAIKYTRNGGQVVVNADTSSEGEFIIFSVKDDGVGLREDKKAEIFESFAISSPGTAAEKGNGIGLRLCKEFVTENGGRIWVESETSKGATFYFTLKAKK